MMRCARAERCSHGSWRRVVLGPTPSAVAQFSDARSPTSRSVRTCAICSRLRGQRRAGHRDQRGGHGHDQRQFPADAPRAFMDEIATTYGLVWYLFGGVLYIYDASETQSEFIYVTNTRPELLQRPLEQLGILDPRFDWRADADLGIILITGPPRYTEMVKQVIQTIEERRADAPGVLVIRLKHASAIDRTISYRDQVITVPGVTSILRELVGLGQGQGVVARTLPATVPALPGLRGQGLAARESSRRVRWRPPRPRMPATSPAADAGQILSDPLGSPVVTIESDPRLNAVIISARGDRLPFFEELIHKLDVPSQLIQIDVTIIDVAANRMTELGVQWEVTSGDFSFGVSSLITSSISAGLGITGMGTRFRGRDPGPGNRRRRTDRLAAFGAHLRQRRGGGRRDRKHLHQGSGQRGRRSVPGPDRHAAAGHAPDRRHRRHPATSSCSSTSATAASTTPCRSTTSRRWTRARSPRPRSSARGRVCCWEGSTGRAARTSTRRSRCSATFPSWAWRSAPSGPSSRAWSGSSC